MNDLKVPVILVGNKIDLRGGEVTNEALEEEIIPIMNEFKVCRFGSIQLRFLRTNFYRKWKPAWNVLRKNH
jgi:GTPase SAR1 family protein